MAACDNLYGNEKEWKELNKFLKKNKPEFLIWMRDKPQKGVEVRICYIAEIQGWLVENCKFDWVQERLNDNFLIQSAICGKAHHE